MMAGAPDRGASRRLPPLPLQQPHRDTTYRRTIPRGGDARPAATRPRRLLYVFAGPERPTDGVRAIAAQLGFEVDEVDMLRGGAEHDVLTTATRARLLGAVRGRVYAAILIATPCTSFSVARGNYADGCVHAGLRTFEHPSGPPGASEAAKAFVRKHDALVDFTADLAHAALDLDLELIIENPAPRNDPELASYWPARAHLPQLWDMPRMRELRATGALSLLVVPQCAFGPGPHGKLFQKYTGLLLSHRAAARLADLRRLRCNHHRHDALACGDDATLAAAYPAALNDALVWALTGVRRTHPLVACAARAPQPSTEAPDTRQDDAPRGAASDELRFDRTVSTGRIADGPRLSTHVRAAVEQARGKRRRWASHRNLEPASLPELRAAPMPDLLPHAGATTSPGAPSQPGAAGRLADFRASLGRNVRVADLWQPEEWMRFQAWMRRARRDAHQAPAYFPQSSLVPLARGYVWDSRNPDDCVPMEPSDRDTVFPGARQIDRAAFRRLAREVGSRDEDIIGQVGEGGVESRSRCALTTELHSHAPGLRARPEAAAKAVDTELAEQWALGPFYLPPTVPIRALPRDVIMQQRSRVVDDAGTVEDYEKPRITLNPSAGPDSVNAGIPKDERGVALTTARDLGYALAIIDVPARDAGHGVAGYGVDMTAAYSFLQVQRLDWWQFAYLWFDAAGIAHFRLLVRVGFGGAMSPRRFQSVSVIITALARAWQQEFDKRHPPPAAVLRWQRERRRLQLGGALPAGSDHVTPAVAGVYIDDLAGGCCDDDVPMPAACHGMPTAGVDLGELAAFALGGKPLRRDSRPAVHCVIAIAAIRSFGLEETAGKTEGGDVFVNLGLRLRLRDGFIDCPPPKRRILLRDLDAWHRKVQELEPFERKTAERQVGRLANLTQVLPELLTHMSAGYRASNAGYTDGGPRRLLKMVPLARDSPMQLGLARLLPHAIDLLQRNEGVPLAPRARFAGLDEPGVLLVVSDASGHDGCGGWAHLGTADHAPAVVSEHWPDWARAALREFKLPAPERTPGAPLLSMPAAELFTIWAVAEAAAAAKPFKAVIAVGDCGPAANALDAASSATPQMGALLTCARGRAKQWLGVAVPREWNVDADRLSHPAQLESVLEDARRASLRPTHVHIPERCWSALRDATVLAASL
jgi:hypothetical protein